MIRVRFVPTALMFLTLAASANAQVDFTRYVALGDSLTQGVSSASIVETDQRTSYPALIARAAGASDFQQPLVSEPGLPAQLALVSLVPSVVIAPKASSPGTPLNLELPRPYNNLGIAGARTADLISKVTDNGGAFDLTLRRIAPALNQAIALQPTFVSMWIGPNDVLSAALSGRAIEGVTLTPVAQFRDSYTTLLGALKQNTQAKIIVANVPDVLVIPYVTTVPTFIVNPATRLPVLGPNGQPIPLIGPDGPVGAGSYVLLTATAQMAQGRGIPVALGGSGQPLGDDVVLSPGEVAAIQARVRDLNAVIASVAGALSVPVLDVNPLLHEIATEGIEIGGIPLSDDFLTGGIFSYDGFHPTRIGYGIIANAFIDRINEAFTAEVPYVDLAPLMFGTEDGATALAKSAGDPEFVFTQAAYDSLKKVTGGDQQRRRRRRR